MSERLTTEREAELRADSASAYVPADHREALAELLAEIAAIRAELADAEARGRAAEQADVCDYLSMHCEGWVPSKLVPAIERGEHIPKGKR